MHPRQHALASPDKPAVMMVETGDSLSYAELDRQADKGAQALRRLGVANGDAVAIWLTNVLDYFGVYWAAQRTGCHIVPISTALTAEEAAYILQDAGARLLVLGADVRAGPEFASASPPPLLRHTLTLGGPVAALPRWEDVVASEPAIPIADELAGFHMVYSSGTTGRPKGVRQALTGGPADAPHPLAERLRDSYGLGDETVFLSPAPLYHTAPLVYSTSVHRMGGTVLLMRRFDPEGALAAIARYKVTATQMVPTMFTRLLRLPEATREAYDMSRSRWWSTRPPRALSR